MEQENLAEKKSGWFVRLLPWLLLVLSLAGNGYLYMRQKSMPSQSSSQAQVAQIMKQVGSLVVLPQNETPTIATVTDLSKLAGQPFFANAKVGDEVLIYSQDQEAILYDPSLNKIVNIAPINGDTNQQLAPAASSSQTATSKK